MQNKYQLNTYFLFKVILFCLIIFLPWSRAISSVATVLLPILAIMELIINKGKISTNRYFLCLLILVLFCLLDGLRAESVPQWLSYFNIKLPLLLIPFSILVFKPKMDANFIKWIGIAFTISISTSTIASTVNYLLHFETLNALVLQSKPIPIMGNMHHITFSIFCAFSIFVAAYFAFFAKIKWLWLIVLINFIGLHILSARTGLVGFYFSSLILGMVYILNQKPKAKYILAALLVIILLPTIAFYSISSFHNRIINSMEDVKTIWHQQDANYQSMGMRVEATKTAYDLIKKYPILGVGCSNVKQAMSIQYEENSTNLFIENRILPHNQFVMEALIHGILGLLVLIVFFLIPFLSSFGNHHLLFIALWGLLFFACMFECIFDRQHGIILITVFWFLFYDFKFQLKLENISSNG